MDTPSNPQAFISYAWTDDEHQQWVLNLATDLRENGGVDVVLDKWDLREGHDVYAFMEKMKTDPNIKKVIIIHQFGQFIEKRAGF